MDYYNANSVLREPLRFLVPPPPPLKIIPRVRKEIVHTTDLSSQVRPGLHQCKDKHYNNKLWNRKARVPVVIDKSTETRIKNISITRTNNSSKNRPAIKITVIQKRKADSIRINKEPTNKISSSSSYHENTTTKTERRKKNRLKTTQSGTDDLAIGGENNEVNLLKLLYCKQILSSLNMDKKKKKEGKKKNDKRNQQRSSLFSNDLMMIEDNVQTAVGNDKGKISFVDNDKGKGLNNRSRVRIMGRLGITDDDRYVLKCAATVDGEPVATDYAEIKRNLSPIKLMFDRNGRVTKIDQGGNQNHNDNINFRVRRSSSTQSNVNVLQDTPNRKFPSRESQTQADFDFKFQAKSRQKDQMVQYEYDPRRNYKKEIKTLNTVDDSTNPFVVISVYPQPSHDNMMRNATSSTTDTKKLKNSETEPSKKGGKGKISRSPSPQRKNNTVSKLPSKSSRSNSPKRKRSPSPLGRSKTGGKVNDTNKANESKMSSRASSVSQQSALGDSISEVPKEDKPNKKIRSMNPNRGAPNTTGTKDGNKKITKTSINRPKKTNRLSIASRTIHQVPGNSSVTDLKKKAKAKNNPKQTPKSKSPDRQPNMKSKSKGAKGEKNYQEITKKAIIDDYTKTLTEHIMRRGVNELHENLPISMTNTSKVSIKIEGENEHYDVLFAQSKQATDLTIRKVLKTTSTQAKEDDYPLNGTEDSTLNEPRKRSLSKILFKPNADADLGLMNASPSRLNVRDSLEISHRREERMSQVRNNNSDLSVSAKHYAGDDCELPDPVKRDKEIRQLLGVNQPHSRRVQTGHKECRTVRYLSKRTKLNKTVKKMRSKLENERKYVDNVPNKYSDSFSENKYVMSKLERGDIIKNPGTTYLKSKHFNDVHGKKFTSDVQNKSFIIVQETQLCPAHKQKILSQNKQILIQIEQIKNNKPIILTKQQYDKVKQIVKRSGAIYKREIQKKCASSTYSIVSVGSVRMKRVRQIYQYRDSKLCDVHTNFMYKESTTSVSAFRCMHHRNKDIIYPNRIFGNRDTIVLFNSIERDREPKSSVRPKNTIYIQESNCFSEDEFQQTLPAQRVPKNTAVRKMSNCSMYTIFKHNRNQPSSTLVTSSHSLRSAGHYGDLIDRNHKPKKALLKRIVSYLIMRCKPSTGTFRVGYEKPTKSQSSGYHINSSLLGTNIDSEMIDTSISFYSNHSINDPVKMKPKKKGIFTILRGYILKS